MVVSNWMRNHPGLVGGALLGGACAGALFYHRNAIGKNVQSWRMLRSVLGTKRRIYVVTSGEAWSRIEPLLLSEAKREGAVGFDCEWVQVRGSRRPVALLQLASCSGVCVLVRLSHMKSDIPDSLKAFLENKSILKVGVGPLEDSNYLYADYNIMVQGCIDLRHLVQRCRQLQRADSDDAKNVKSAGGMGLNALSEKYLGRTLDKDWRVRASDWEADILTKRQENYAAEDALVGIHILMMMVEKLWMPSSPSVPFLPSPQWHCQLNSAILQVCSGLLDVKFSNKKDQDSGPVMKSKQNHNLKPKTGTKAYSIRKEPLYHHCQLWAPDNMPLCMIDPKKAHWYLDKDLGELVSEEPLVVRLKFEPAGRPLMETQAGKFRLQERKNVCVVCGEDESYIRKNIVPHEYRRFFPSILKSHENHDIVLLCVKCHKQSNVFDSTMRNQLAGEFNAPMSTENGAKTNIDKSLKVVRQAANALLKSRQDMPENRARELEDVVKNFFKTDELSKEHLDDASKMDVMVRNEDYQAHSQVVYQAYKNIGIVKLEQRWREHFLSSMKPKHMPDCWSVTHNAMKVRHKMSSLPLDHLDREIYKTVLVGTDGSIDVPYNPPQSRENSPIDIPSGTSTRSPSALSEE